MNDPYVYPGTDVLRNQADIRNANQLERYERLLTGERMNHIINVSTSIDGYKTLHKYLFEEVYDWAGEFRSVNIAKGDMFCLFPHIETQLKIRFDAIRKENDLKNLTPEKFAESASKHFTEINAIHPFREGNGRTQRMFLKSLGRQAGHKINLYKIDLEQWMKAAVQGFHGNNKPMEQVILKALGNR